MLETCVYGEKYCMEHLRITVGHPCFLAYMPWLIGCCSRAWSSRGRREPHVSLSVGGSRVNCPRMYDSCSARRGGRWGNLPASRRSVCRVRLRAPCVVPVVHVARYSYAGWVESSGGGTWVPMQIVLRLLRLSASWSPVGANRYVP